MASRAGPDKNAAVSITTTTAAASIRDHVLWSVIAADPQRSSRCVPAAACSDWTPRRRAFDILWLCLIGPRFPCGGAFYGVVDAPSNVTISKGVLVIQQDHGSRWTTDLTYRFRYDEQPSMFILIGFDYVSNDRAAGGTSTESTNYLTGKRITTVSKNSKSTTKTAVINKMRYSLEEVDTENFEEDATKRLGLD